MEEIKLKICSKCKIEKEYKYFHVCKSKNCGIRSQCKECTNLNTRIKNIDNKEQIKIRNKEYQKDNKEYFINYRNEHKEHHNEINKKYREENKEFIKDINIKYRKNNREKVNQYARTYFKKLKDTGKFDYVKHNINKLERHNERMQNDTLYHMKHNIRGVIKKAISNKFYIKSKKTLNILGCNFEEFKKYIESKFDDKMNWNNHGTYWIYDHIKPISLATNEQEVYELNHYTNFQSLEKIENLYKSNKYPYINKNIII